MGSLYSHYEEENSSSNTANLLNPEEFRRQGHMIIDFIADYYQNMEKYPVLSQVQPGYLAKLLPNGSIAGFPGEVLSTGFNVVGFNWISSPAATELEFVTMDWLGQMLGLPQSFLFSGTGGGVIQGTTCETILCTLVAARDQMLAKVGRENIGKLVFYGSDQTHCALLKAAKVAGTGSLYSHYEEENSSSNTAHLLNPEEFRRQGHMIIDFIADYYQNMEKYPVLSQVQPGYLAKLLPKSSPNIPEPIETILHDTNNTSFSA
ncbi:tyrosine/DOPA decarboxylase 2-like [Gossypium australe]|uniref:Tyrosine/DOPA decarboxylase 2-like n=1 Tax=Gossypium australe TaxID=47621 RepID=A0A5B6WJE0_9ROSI|nr:tyrosine/DOPA decarboxylase 2-like [Gossypium australe]